MGGRAGGVRAARARREGVVTVEVQAWWVRGERGVARDEREEEKKRRREEGKRVDTVGCTLDEGWGEEEKRKKKREESMERRSEEKEEEVGVVRRR